MRTKPTPLPLILCAALMGGAACTDAPQRGVAADPIPAAEGERLALLEAVFWSCDYLATTQGMDATPVRQCAAATRELREIKFAGSFHRMLAWWRANKPAEHEKARVQRGDPL